MFDLQFIDKAYSSKNRSSYELSILTSQDGFSFCLYHKATKQVVVLKHKDFRAATYDELLTQVRNIFAADNLLQAKYEKVKLAYQNTTNTLIPNEILEIKNLKQYLSFQHSLHELDEIHYQPIPDQSAHAIFALPNYVANEAIEIHPKVKFFHQSIPLIALALEKSKTQKGNLILVNKSKRFFDVVLIRDNKLQLYNTFTFHTDNDFVYFVMSVYKQLQLDKENIPFFVSGLIRPENEDYHLLTKFIGHVSLEISPKEIANLKMLKQKTIPSMFAPLFGLILCE